MPGSRRRADLAFASARTLVFIDGCFWHGCPEHGQVTTKQNADYWSAKFLHNRERDVETNQLLEAAGWQVLRFWEHEAPAEVESRRG